MSKAKVAEDSNTFCGKGNVRLPFGAEEGLGDGISVGPLVGAKEGPGDGISVGACVVGEGVGAFVGLSVGALVAGRNSGNSK